jgi:hypothetical protein
MWDLWFTWCCMSRECSGMWSRVGCEWTRGFLKHSLPLSSQLIVIPSSILEIRVLRFFERFVPTNYKLSLPRAEVLSQWAESSVHPRLISIHVCARLDSLHFWWSELITATEVMTEVTRVVLPHPLNRESQLYTNIQKSVFTLIIFRVELSCEFGSYIPQSV